MKRPDDDDVTMLDYAAPSVNGVYVPISGALTDERYYRAPSVTIMPGECQEKNGAGEMPVVLVLLAWDPGTRTEYQSYDLNGDGWKSISMLLDTVVRHLRKTGYIGGMSMKDGLRYGLYDSNFSDMRPYYFGWIECTFEYRYAEQSAAVNDLLN